MSHYQDPASQGRHRLAQSAASSSSQVPSTSSSASSASHPTRIQYQTPVPIFPYKTVLSSEKIDKYLDENEVLMAAALEHQRLGRFDCNVKYLEKVQEYLKFLGFIADMIHSDECAVAEMES